MIINIFKVKNTIYQFSFLCPNFKGDAEVSKSQSNAKVQLKN